MEETVWLGQSSIHTSSKTEQQEVFDACKAGDVVVCEKLLRLGKCKADINDSVTGMTLLCVACDKGDSAMVSMLLENSARVTGCCAVTGNSPLHFAALRGYKEICRLLLAYDSTSVHVESVNGFTPLHVAAFRGHLEICRLLVDAGADRTRKTKEGWLAWECTSDAAVSNFLHEREIGEGISLRAFASAPVLGVFIQQRVVRTYRERSISVWTGIAKGSKGDLAGRK